MVVGIMMCGSTVLRTKLIPGVYSINRYLCIFNFNQASSHDILHARWKGIFLSEWYSNVLYTHLLSWFIVTELSQEVILQKLKIKKINLLV